MSTIQNAETFNGLFARDMFMQRIGNHLNVNIDSFADETVHRVVSRICTAFTSRLFGSEEMAHAAIQDARNLALPLHDAMTAESSKAFLLLSMYFITEDIGRAFHYANIADSALEANPSVFNDNDRVSTRLMSYSVKLHPAWSGDLPCLVAEDPILGANTPAANRLRTMSSMDPLLHSMLFRRRLMASFGTVERTAENSALMDQFSSVIVDWSNCCL